MNGKKDEFQLDYLHVSPSNPQKKTAEQGQRGQPIVGAAIHR